MATAQEACRDTNRLYHNRRVLDPVREELLSSSLSLLRGTEGRHYVAHMSSFLAFYTRDS